MLGNEGHLLKVWGTAEGSVKSKSPKSINGKGAMTSNFAFFCKKWTVLIIIYHFFKTKTVVVALFTEPDVLIQLCNNLEIYFWWTLRSGDCLVGKLLFFFWETIGDMTMTILPKWYCNLNVLIYCLKLRLTTLSYCFKKLLKKKCFFPFI